MQRGNASAADRRLEAGPDESRLRVLRGVLLDQSADEIAKAIGRKKKTVEWHIEQTRKEWKVHSRAAINTILLTTAWRIQMRRVGEGPPL